MTTMDSAELPPTWVDLKGAPAIAGLRFRRPRRDAADYAAMAALISECNRHDDVPFIPSATNLREEMEASTSCDPASDMVLAEIDGLLVGDAAVDRTIRDDMPVFEISGHVLPAYRRRGIGRAMLDHNLQRVRERGATEPDGRHGISAHADDTEIGHQALLVSAGFAAVRYFLLMRRPSLDAIDDVPLPDGLAFETVRPEQHRAIWDAEVEAFRDHWQARQPTEDEFDSLFVKEDLATELWVVAWDGDQVAGVVQSWIWRDENEQLGVRRGWLEHISVRRPWRRRGLGAAMIAEALRRLAGVGMDEAMLGVDSESPTGAVGLYQRSGFVPHARATAYRLAPAAGPTDESGNQTSEGATSPAISRMLPSAVSNTVIEA